jgi:hypothetical protein
VGVDCIVSENKKGEQLLADFLGATGLFKKFAEAFPGDVSIFEPGCMDKVKVKLPGKTMRIKTKQNGYKDKKGQDQIAVNIVGFGKVADKIEELEKMFEGKGGSAGGGKKESKEKKTVVEDDDF